MTMPVAKHRRRRSLSLAACLFALPAVCVGSAWAQAIDYGALQQLLREPVTTSVDGSPERASDVPATMEIITAEEIRRSGAKDIPGVLQHVAGVDVMRWGNDDADVSIRGYDQPYSPRLLVLLDGRQVYADDYGYTPWNTIPVELNEIRQIEVIKGPNTALFGFNAVAGVINIITYNPLYDDVNDVTLGGGTQGSANGSLVGSWRKQNKIGVRLLAGLHHDSDFDTAIPSPEFVGSRHPEGYGSVKVSSVMRVGAKTYLAAEGSHSLAHENEMLPFYQMDNVQYRTEAGKLQLTSETKLGLLQLTGYSNWLSAMISPGIFGQPLVFHNRVVVAQGQDIFRAGADHTFRLTAEYRNNTETSTPVRGASVYYSDFAASGMWSWKIAPSVSLTNSVRVDALMPGRSGYTPPGYIFSNSDWKQNRTIPSFNSGVVWRMNDANAVRFVVGRGSEMPNLDIFGAYLQVSPPFVLSGNPNLQQSDVTNYEAEWDHKLASPNLLLRGSVFHQHSDHVLSIDGNIQFEPTGIYYLVQNVGDSDADGLEVGAKGRFQSEYHWDLSYRPEKIHDHLIPVAQTGYAFLDNQHSLPLHTMKGSLGWSRRQWDIDGFVRFQSYSQGLQPIIAGMTLVPTHRVSVPAWAALDTRVGYHVTERMTFSVSGQNLTQARQLQNSGPEIGRTVLGSMSLRF